MGVSYQPLWDLLKNKNMKKKDLMIKAKLTTNCIASMGKNSHISMKNIEKICIALDCDIDNILSFKKEVSSE